MNDPAPYVRKTAALAVAKLHRLSPQVLQRQVCHVTHSFKTVEVSLLCFLMCVQTGWVNKLYELVADRDPTVAHNALAALQEVNVIYIYVCVCVIFIVGMNSYKRNPFLDFG